MFIIRKFFNDYHSFSKTIKKMKIYIKKNNDLKKFEPKNFIFFLNVTLTFGDHI